MPMSHVSVAYFPPCHVSNLRNSQVSCASFLPPCRMLLSLMSHVEFKKSSCRRVEFRGLGPSKGGRWERGTMTSDETHEFVNEAVQ